MGDRCGQRMLTLLSVRGLVAIGLLAVGAIGCGGGGDGTTATATASGCKRVEPPRARTVSYRAPKQTVKRGQTLTAVVKTSCGTFEIALDTKRFLATANSFAFLAEKGFYDGLAFDEAAEGTYLHGGDPPGGARGPGYSVKGEIPSAFIYRRGVVAMAHGEAPGRAGSEFFVALAAPWIDLSGIYPPLGTVERGLDVLERISEFGAPALSGSRNTGVIGEIRKLRRTVLIEKISIEKG